MGNVIKSKSQLVVGTNTLNVMGKIKYGSDFGGITSTPSMPEIIAHMVSSINETAMGDLIDNSSTPICTVSGLDITTNFGSHIVNDIDTIVADPTDTLFAKVSLLIDDTTGDPEVYIFIKTDGLYGNIPAGKIWAADLKEFSVPAAGTILIEIQNWIV